MTPLIARIHEQHERQDRFDPACPRCVEAKEKAERQRPAWVRLMASNAHELTPGRA